MDVVEVWSGRHAGLLQSALRLTNEGFAARLGVSVRTIAAWHADPAVVPRTEMQQVLDTALEKAPEAARRRFALLVGPATARGRSGGEPEAGAQVLRVAISVVVHGEDVLLVCRRDDEVSGITWQFPAGVIKPGARADTTAVRETLDETGVHCAVRRSLGNRLHPVTGVMCEYFLAEYLAGEATNSDAVENVDVMWVPGKALTRFISVDTIFPPILAALEEQT